MNKQQHLHSAQVMADELRFRHPEISLARTQSKVDCGSSFRYACESGAIFSLEIDDAVQALALWYGLAAVVQRQDWYEFLG
ncbi:MAG: hypothetical protein HN856_15365 [Gammaproteobacteria bacterium]|nr:hypothetical protein [Gammaproteobacteria bacterium]